VRHSRSLHKCVYCGHHAYLKKDHPYSRQKTCFNGQEENREAPLPITSEYIIENGHRIMLFIESGGIFGSRDDPCNESGVK
jgi:hypothetical protein